MNQYLTVTIMYKIISSFNLKDKNVMNVKLLDLCMLSEVFEYNVNSPGLRALIVLYAQQLRDPMRAEISF